MRPNPQPNPGKGLNSSIYAPKTTATEDIVSLTKNMALDTASKTKAAQHLQPNADRSTPRPSHQQEPFICTNCSRRFTGNRSEFFAVHLQQCKSFASKNGKFTGKYDQNTGQLKSAPSSDLHTPVVEPAISNTTQDVEEKEIANKWGNARTVTSLGSKSATAPKAIQSPDGMDAGSRFAPPTLDTALQTPMAERPQASNLSANTKPCSSARMRDGNQEANTFENLFKGLIEEFNPGSNKGVKDARVDEPASIDGFSFMTLQDAGQDNEDSMNTFTNVLDIARSQPGPSSISSASAATAPNGSSAKSSSNTFAPSEAVSSSNPFRIDRQSAMTSKPFKTDQSIAATSNLSMIARPIAAASNPIKVERSTVTTNIPFKPNQTTAFASNNPFADSATGKNSAVSPDGCFVAPTLKTDKQAFPSLSSHSESPKGLPTPMITSGRCYNNLQGTDKSIRSQGPKDPTQSRFRTFFESLNKENDKLSKLMKPELEDWEVGIGELSSVSEIDRDVFTENQVNRQDIFGSITTRSTRMGISQSAPVHLKVQKKDKEATQKPGN